MVNSTQLLMINDTNFNFIIKNRCNVTMPNKDEDTVNRSKEGFNEGAEIATSTLKAFATVLNVLGKVTDFLFRRTKNKAEDYQGTNPNESNKATLARSNEVESPLSEKVGRITRSLNARHVGESVSRHAQHEHSKTIIKTADSIKPVTPGFAQQILNISEGKQFKDQLPLVEVSEAEKAAKDQDKSPSP